MADNLWHVHSFGNYTMNIPLNLTFPKSDIFIFPSQPQSWQVTSIRMFCCGWLHPRINLIGLKSCTRLSNSVWTDKMETCRVASVSYLKWARVLNYESSERTVRDNQRSVIHNNSLSALGKASGVSVPSEDLSSLFWFSDFSNEPNHFSVSRRLRLALSLGVCVAWMRSCATG